MHQSHLSNVTAVRRLITRVESITVLDDAIILRPAPKRAWKQAVQCEGLATPV